MLYIEHNSCFLAEAESLAPSAAHLTKNQEQPKQSTQKIKPECFRTDERYFCVLNCDSKEACKKLVAA